MKGIIFNLLEAFIIENWGEEKYEEMLKASILHTKEPFVGPGTYPDADLFAIVNSAAVVLGISVPEAMKAFGNFMFPQLAKKYPNFVTPYSHPKEFLMTIDSVIHVEVKKLYKDAVTPRFMFQNNHPETLAFDYQSIRKMCPLVEGMLDGVATYYQTPISYHQTSCLLHGAPSCHFELRFG